MSLIRRFKPAYAFYNLFQHRRLANNAALYKKLGLRKSYFSPISSQDFAHLPARPVGPSPSLAERLAGAKGFEMLPAATQASLLSFEEQGFAVLPGFFAPARVEAINTALEKLVATGQLSFRYRNKLMLAFQHSPLIRQAAEDPQLLAVLSALLGHEARLFQSINFLTGSEQHTHSDSIHMSTYPLGGLIAAWVALEDITPENGPLHYFPGSHQLPYYLNADYDNQGSTWFIGDKDYSAYEAFIKQRVADLGLKKEVFLAKKGDIFIWHANLLHGGEPQTNKSLTRKSMVLHYFSTDHVCYHEITQRPALL